MSQKHQSRPRLSVSMIVKNEEAFLDECLKSVREVADDIVIVDTGSTDRTKEIAFRWDARVYDFEWNGDFAAARNFSLGHCTGDWVLYIDADERLDAESARRLPALLRNAHADAYLVLIKNPQTMQQGRFHQENTYPRLFRRAQGVQFEGRVHEQLWPSLLRHKKNVLPSPLIIHHLGYDQGYEAVRRKAERNCALLRQHLVEQPDDAYAQFQLGNTLVVLQRYEEAKPILERAIQHPKLDRSNRASCYNLLAEVAVRTHQPDEAVRMCRKSLELAPTQLMARWFLALLHADGHEFDASVGILREILQALNAFRAGRVHHIASDLALSESDVRERLAVTFEAAGKPFEAMLEYIELLRAGPAKEATLQGFFRCARTVTGSQHSKESLMRIARMVSDLLNEVPAQPDVYAIVLNVWAMVNDRTAAQHVVMKAEERGVSSFEWHKAALQWFLREGNVQKAFHHLEKMAQSTDADLTPLRARLETLAARLAAGAAS